MEYYAISKKGRREKNEDSYIAEKINNFYLFAVADGLGGHMGGGIASRIAIIELKETIKRDGKNGLTNAFQKANDSILHENKEKGYNMGTTMVACIVSNDGKCTISNVGDSRAYIFNGGIWRTKDHSLVQELIDKKVISEEEAFNHSKKNIVTQALGLEKTVRIDMYQKSAKNSILLLCSDGLSDYVKDKEIAEIAKKYPTKKACEKLYKKAFKNGSGDNITIIIVDFRGKTDDTQYNGIGG